MKRIDTTRLEKEVRSIDKGRKETGRQKDFSEVYQVLKISNGGDIEMDRARIAGVFNKHELGFFARKVISGYYDIEKVSKPTKKG